MATAKLAIDAESWKVGLDSSARLRLLVFYDPLTEDAADIEAAAEAMLPTIWGVYILRSFELNFQSYGIYECVGNYTRAQANDPEDPTEGEPPEFSFEITSQQVKVLASLAVVSTGTASGKTIPDNGVLIGVQPDGTIEGVEVPQMVYTFSESWYFAAVTSAYRNTLAALVGTVNFGATFRGFAAGEVLSTGIMGAKQGADLWKLSFQFACIPNIVGGSVGGITGINKAGWDYIEWFSDEKVNATTKRIERELLGYKVHRVLRTGNFAAFGIGTS
jgi:hypothetical protein